MPYTRAWSITEIELDESGYDASGSYYGVDLPLYLIQWEQCNSHNQWFCESEIVRQFASPEIMLRNMRRATESNSFVQHVAHVTSYYRHRMERGEW